VGTVATDTTPPTQAATFQKSRALPDRTMALTTVAAEVVIRVDIIRTRRPTTIIETGSMELRNRTAPCILQDSDGKFQAKLVFK
jgi:hypothetical protein